MVMIITRTVGETDALTNHTNQTSHFQFFITEQNLWKKSLSGEPFNSDFAAEYLYNKQESVAEKWIAIDNIAFLKLADDSWQLSGVVTTIGILCF